MLRKRKKIFLLDCVLKYLNEPGKLGEVSSLIGINECNIINMEIVCKKELII